MELDLAGQLAFRWHRFMTKQENGKGPARVISSGLNKPQGLRALEQIHVVFVST